MIDEYDHDLPDDLADRIRRYAERHDDATPAGVLGAVDALDPTDLEDVRAVLDGGESLNLQNGGDTGDSLVKTGKPVTESNGNGGVDEEKSAPNVSGETNRKTNTPEGDGTGGDDTAGL